MMRKFSIPFLIVLGMAAVALATPGSGVVSNVILATGTTLDALSEEVLVDGNVDGDDNAQHGNHWQVKLATSGVSNFYVQDATIAPGGYSGWHTHPGVLLVTVRRGERRLVRRKLRPAPLQYRRFVHREQRTPRRRELGNRERSLARRLHHQAGRGAPGRVGRSRLRRRPRPSVRLQTDA